MRFMKSSRNGAKAVPSMVAGALLVFCPLIGATTAHADGWTRDAVIITDATASAGNYGGTASGHISLKDNQPDGKATSTQNTQQNAPSVGAAFSGKATYMVGFSWSGSGLPPYYPQQDINRPVDITASGYNGGYASAKCAVTNSSVGIDFKEERKSSDPPSSSSPDTMFYVGIPRDPADPTRAVTYLTLEVKADGGRGSSSSGTWFANAATTISFINHPPIP